MTTASLPNQPTLERQAAYWRQRLSGQLPLLELPLDNPRPLVSSFVRERERIVVGEEVYQKLRTFCAQHEISAFVILLAALKILLLRYTGEKDIIVGWSPTDSSCLDTSGGKEKKMTLNPVTLRTDLSGNPRVSVILSRVADTMREAVINGQYPFQSVLQDMEKNGVSEFLPFRVMFDMEDHIDEIPTARKSEARSYLSQDLRVQCDFILNIFTKEQFVFQVEYDAELFEPATMRRLATHYYTVLEGMVANPNQNLAILSLLTDYERHQLLVEWNPPVLQDPQTHCVHYLFEAQAARTPEAIAIVYEDEQLTYEALNEKVNQLAHYLIRQGVGPEVRVAFCLERSTNLFIALLGILKAGGAYVPLDPSTPYARMKFIFTEAQVGLVLTQSSLLKLFHGQNLSTSLESELQPPQWVAIDDPDFGIYSCDSSDPKPIVSPDNLAYVIYTSGSTGHPKGVAITQASLTQFSLSASLYLGIEASDRVLQFASLAFDGAVEEIFPCLIRGGTLVLRTENMIDTVSTFLNAVQTRQLTVLDLPTAYWHELTASLSEKPFSIPDSIRLVAIGGEQAQGDQLAIWHQHIPSTLNLLNGYGPTETTVVTSVEFLSNTGTGGNKQNVPTISIGRPLENRTIYIVDSHLQPTPVGVLGELCIGGQGLARCYDHHPELTATTFIPDCYSNQPGSRMYRTGDRGYYRADGRIQLSGRVDHQVKIRGYRIELGEIEAMLSQHPEVEAAVVLCREDSSVEKHLVAYAKRGQKGLKVADLLAYLKGRLPGYMVPGAFVILEQLPLTPNGKVDKQALLAPELIDRTQYRIYVAPGNVLENLLVEVWQEVLKIERIGIHDNFFELGGHSLLATQVIVRLRQTLELDIPLRTLFEHPTVAQLASVIDTQLTNVFSNWPRDESPTSGDPSTI